MPTVMGFIIISSMIILYQSVAMVSELYSLKAAEQELYLNNYIVNTRRVVKDIDIGDKCDLNVELNYQSKDQLYKMETNCIYTGVSIPEYNQVITNLQTTSELTEVKYDQLYQQLRTSETEIKNDKVKIDEQNEYLTYEDRLYISIIEYGSNKMKKILITDQNGNVINNINVK